MLSDKVCRIHGELGIRDTYLTDEGLRCFPCSRMHRKRFYRDNKEKCDKKCREYYYDNLNTVKIECGFCGKLFDKLERVMKRHKHKKNYYCSKSCGGKASRL